MNRRTYLALLATGPGLAGCLSEGGGPGGTVTPLDSSTKGTETRTAIRQTGANTEATFRVLGGHAPTDEAASATFGDAQVTVEGTMDPGGCREPTLTTLSYDPVSGVVELVVGTAEQYETVEVECGNASYDYRCEIDVTGETPTAVDVVHDFAEREKWTTTIERG